MTTRWRQVKLTRGGAGRLTAAMLGVLALGCGGRTADEPIAEGAAGGEVRSVTKEEALADFDQLVSAVRSLYGPLERKEQRYGFSWEQLVAEYRARVEGARSEPQLLGILQELVARLRDAHVSLDFPIVADDARTFSLGLMGTPVADAVLIAHIAPDAEQALVSRGDELLAVDGVPVSELIDELMKYQGAPSDETRRHFAVAYLTQRPIYLAGMVPTKPTALLSLRRPDGVEYVVERPWVRGPSSVPQSTAPKAGASTPETALAMAEKTLSSIQADLALSGVRVPFFMSAAVRAKLGVSEEVAPSAAALARHGLSADATTRSHYFAARYRAGGKEILLVRIPSYTPPDPLEALNYLAALLEEQEPQVDGLVIDQTHNPGGNLQYAGGVLQVLTSRPVNGLVQRMNADRMWLQTYLRTAELVRSADPSSPLAEEFEARARLVDEAYSAGESLSTPIPYFFDAPTMEPHAVHWKKPALMLIDELSVSCADFVPAALKANGIMPLFGQRTMGGGGNVEQATELVNTRAILKLTRGLGTVFDPTGDYPEERFVEDNGVTPDVVYTHTVQDWREGFVGYVDAFNRTLLERIDAATK